MNVHKNMNLIRVVGKRKCDKSFIYYVMLRLLGLTIGILSHHIEANNQLDFCVFFPIQSKLFDGLEEEDNTLNSETFVTRRSIKKLVIKNKGSQDVSLL